MNRPEVVSIGTMLVEVMRTGIDEPLDQPGSFAGPYPSGDTAIYIDAVARLGRSAGYIGAVGRDAFGRCLLDRFARDGVDFSCGKILDSWATGVAFVAYFGDGSRTFLFHWQHAAAGQLFPEDVRPAYLSGARWLHLSGCNMAVSAGARDACYQAISCLPPGARLSFDPNIRPELLSAEQIRELCRPAIERANIIFPSVGEAALLTGAASDREGCRLWAEQGKTVVLKQGERGCTIYTQQAERAVPGFAVEAVDPTGAGDAFCAGFTVALLEGMPLDEAGRFANGVGALAVTRRGPMEGTPTRADVIMFLSKRSST